MCDKKETKLHLIESAVLGDGYGVGVGNLPIAGVRTYARNQPFLWFRVFGADGENPGSNAGVRITFKKGDQEGDFIFASDQLFALPSNAFDEIIFTPAYTGLVLLNLYVED